MWRAIAVAVLKHAPPRQSRKNVDRVCEPRCTDFFLDQFAAFRLEAQLDCLAIDGNVRFEQCCRAASAAQPRILFASWTNSAARDEFDHGGKCKFARRLTTAEMLADAALNARQRVCQPGEPARLRISRTR